MKLSAKILMSAAVLLSAGIVIAAPGKGPGSHQQASRRHTTSRQYQIMDNYQEAQRLARKTHKPIMIIFSGSDWCGWCIKLEKEVFSKPEFKNWAKDNIIVYLADFPRRNYLSAEKAKQNNLLLKEYGVRGFPTVLIVNERGQILGKTGYRPGGPKKYVDHLKKIIR